MTASTGVTISIAITTTIATTVTVATAPGGAVVGASGDSTGVTVAAAGSETRSDQVQMAEARFFRSPQERDLLIGQFDEVQQLMHVHPTARSFGVDDLHRSSAFIERRTPTRGRGLSIRLLVLLLLLLLLLRLCRWHRGRLMSISSSMITSYCATVR
uniref:Uncharacterized protein n=1 Tax=Anopheles darlingi TaxID=43151 RepID=A0A2M4DK57_ANODA